MTQSLNYVLKWQVPAAAFTLGLLVLPAMRDVLEASMTRQMLVQFPLLLLSGLSLAGSLPPTLRAAANRWNRHGICGLFTAAMLLAFMMIPRLLDLALTDIRIEVAKWLALLTCGAAIRLSWQPAGLVMQGFFLGNVLPMMAVIGYLFDSSPVRLCNAYLIDDQEALGQKLVWIAAMIGLTWLASVFRQLIQTND